MKHANTSKENGETVICEEVEKYMYSIYGGEKVITILVVGRSSEYCLI